MTPLVPCAACNRHVRASEVCPFCGAETRQATSSPLGRSSRAALLALASMACGQPAPVSAYGGPPATIEADAGTPPPPPASSSSTPATVVPPSSSETTHVSAYGGPPTQTTPQIAPKH